MKFPVNRPHRFDARRVLTRRTFITDRQSNDSHS
jgi:hypothetical protein